MTSIRLKNITEDFSLATLLAFSLIPDSYSQMVKYPGIVIWQLGFVLAGISLILVKKHESTFGFGKFISAIGLGTIIVISGSSALSAFPGSSFWYFGMLLGYILFATMMITSRYNPIHLIYSVGAVGFISSILSFINWYPIREYTMVGGGYQNKFMLGHHNFVGGYLVIIIGTVIGLFLYEKGIKKYVLACMLPILFINLYTTSSRGAMIGLLTGVIFILLWVQLRRFNLKSIMISIVVITSAVSLLLTHPRVQTLISLNIGSNQPIAIDGNAQVRLRMWEVCLEIANKHPLTGVGLGNLAKVYNDYAQNNETLNVIPNLHQAHNTFFQFLAELGWTGAIVYCAWIFLFWKVWREAFLANVNRKEQLCVIGIGIAFSSYILSSLTDYQLENVPISLSLIILLISLLKMISHNHNFVSTNRAMRQHSYITNKTFHVCVLLLMVGIFIPRSYGMYLGYQANDSISVNAGLMENSIVLQKLAIAHKMSPFDPIYSIQSASILQKEMDLNNTINAESRRAVITYYQQAFKAAPAVDYINFNLGYWLLHKDPEQAIQYLKNALRYSYSSHDNYFCNYLLGYAYLLQGDTDNAVYFLSIQSLFDPGFLTYPLWEEPIMKTIQSQVISKTISLFESFPQSGFSLDNTILLKWWFNIPDQPNLDNLRPLIRGIILSDRDPLVAKETLLNLTDDEEKLLINYIFYPDVLRNEFSYYLENYSGLSKVDQDRLLNMSDLSTIDLRDWLSQLTLSHKPGVFGLGSFVGRNTTFGNRFFSTEVVKRYWLPLKLNLWTPVSVYSPEFNRFLREDYFPRLM